MPSIIVESPDNVVASFGNTDLTATKAGANKALEQKNFVFEKLTKTNLIDLITIVNYV